MITNHSKSTLLYVQRLLFIRYPNASSLDAWFARRDKSLSSTYASHVWGTWLQASQAQQEMMREPGNRWQAGPGRDAQLAWLQPSDISLARLNINFTWLDACLNILGICHASQASELQMNPDRTAMTLRLDFYAINKVTECMQFHVKLRNALPSSLLTVFAFWSNCSQIQLTTV